MTLGRFLRTAKGQCVVALAIVALPAIVSVGASNALPLLGASIAGAMLIDAPILRVAKRRWVFPGGALLTGAIVGMVLSPHVHWFAAAATAGIGVVGKYFVRVRTANVFNPAALGLVATFYPLHTGQSWWGALPEARPAALLLLLAAGVYMTLVVNKLPAVLAFLGVYFLLFTGVAFLGNAAHVVTIYRAPDLHAALYFAFFMLTDPPTSPPRHRDQWLFGALVAAASFVAFEGSGAVYFLSAGVLVGNVWEAVRRWRLHNARARSSLPASAALTAD